MFWHRTTRCGHKTPSQLSLNWFDNSLSAGWNISLWSLFVQKHNEQRFTRRPDSSGDYQAGGCRGKCFPCTLFWQQTCDVVMDEPLHVSEAGHEGSALPGPIRTRSHWSELLFINHALNTEVWRSFHPLLRFLSSTFIITPTVALFVCAEQDITPAAVGPFDCQHKCEIRQVQGDVCVGETEARWHINSLLTQWKGYSNSTWGKEGAALDYTAPQCHLKGIFERFNFNYFTTKPQRSPWCIHFK